MVEQSIVVSFPPGPMRAAVGRLPAGVEVVEWDLDGPAPRPEIDLVVRPSVRGLEPLRWLSTVRARVVQSPAVGYDGVADVLPAGHALANAAGVHEASTAELAVALVLAAQRGVPDYVRAAAEGRWATAISPGLLGRTVLLLGVGGIGSEIAARLRPFGCDLVLVGRTARDGVRGADELPALLPRADVVVVSVRLDATTTGLVDAAFLARMASGALLVNVARGAVVDTPALVAEVGSGRLRAALDVTDPEPLPPDHPLWSLPNVLVTPHVAGATPEAPDRLARLVRAQIDRLVAGLEPLNVVVRT
ncbi:MAG: 2-hydroxyacid dehydrogenase [Lapillicoccus sp.]